MTPPRAYPEPPPALPERQRLAREITRYRAALMQDVWIFDNLADSIGIVRGGQAARARLRAGELRKLLNAAPSPPPDVPVTGRAAEATQPKKGASRVNGGPNRPAGETVHP